MSRCGWWLPPSHGHRNVRPAVKFTPKFDAWNSMWRKHTDSRTLKWQFPSPSLFQGRMNEYGRTPYGWIEMPHVESWKENLILWWVFDWGSPKLQWGVKWLVTYNQRPKTAAGVAAIHKLLRRENHWFHNVSDNIWEVDGHERVMHVSFILHNTNKNFFKNTNMWIWPYQNQNQTIKTLHQLKFYARNLKRNPSLHPKATCPNHSSATVEMPAWLHRQRGQWAADVLRRHQSHPRGTSETNGRLEQSVDVCCSQLVRHSDG